ncbi:MAG: sugar ABC transporter ATP-binding protein [Candidatus Caldatribacteriaceae bacterium]
MIADVILEVEGLSKGFPGVQALKKVDFSLCRGEIHCLVGENGAGKSTFIKILSGALVPDEGVIRIFGRSYTSLTPSLAIELGIQTVYQESILVSTLSVAENIFLGQERLTSHGFFHRAKTNEDARKLIESFGISLDPEELVENLSHAERQIVGILKALSREAKILILDEPTASLSAVEKKTLFEILRKITRQGVGVIYISHHLEEVFEIGNRVTVLKDGMKVMVHETKAVNYDLLIQEMVGRPAELFYTREKSISPEARHEVLEIVNLRGGVVKEASFQVHAGEIFGIGGMVGSGRTELVRLLFGLDRREGGKVILEGKEITPRSPIDAIAKGVCLITEDRQKTGLVLVRSVKENIMLPSLNLGRREILDLRREREVVKELVAKLRIVTPHLEQEVVSLSGGNQQKVVLAKWLLTNSKVYVFDEPTRGIDVGAKEEIYRLMMELVRAGKFVIMVSSDMPELIALSDRVGVMCNGVMVKILEGEAVTEEKILACALGMVG